VEHSSGGEWSNSSGKYATSLITFAEAMRGKNQESWSFEDALPFSPSAQYFSLETVPEKLTSAIEGRP